MLAHFSISWSAWFLMQRLALIRSHRNEKNILSKIELKRKRLRKRIVSPFDFGTTTRRSNNNCNFWLVLSPQDAKIRRIPRYSPLFCARLAVDLRSSWSEKLCVGCDTPSHRDCGGLRSKE